MIVGQKAVELNIAEKDCCGGAVGKGGPRLMAAGKGSALRMKQNGSQFLRTAHRDPMKLFKREWMFFFNKQQRTGSHGLYHDTNLQVDRLGIERQSVIQPAFVWSPCLLATLKLPAVFDFIEDCFMEADP